MLSFETLVKEIDKRCEYERRIVALKEMGFQTNNIEETVERSLSNIEAGYNSFVIYGEPQCGKTELMIALTARLIDEGRKIIIVLLNDDTDLLTQNLQRFRASSINPTPINYTEILEENIGARKWIIFCKKNAKDLFKLNNALSCITNKVIIDDEGDYASPNGKVNKDNQTKINELISNLMKNKGVYIGVTVTPARLDLNNTFQNLTERWVQFKAHDNYVGKEIFFPVNGNEELQFALKKLPETGDKPEYIRKAIANFIVNSSMLNTLENLLGNYAFLIHTSGEVDEHSKDRKDVINYFEGLIDSNSIYHKKYWDEIIKIINEKCVDENLSIKVFNFAYQNITNQSVSIINSKNKNNIGVDTTAPASIFSVFIGGNKVSRGITFGNLIGMFFTRDVQKIQQDTYIQRARMFGNRKKYLKYFELWITKALYNDWRRCFMYHYLSLMSITTNGNAPVWIGDQRIRPVATQSIDKKTLLLDKGEMVFPKFKYSKEIELILQERSKAKALGDLKEYLGSELFPKYIYDFILTNCQSVQNDIIIFPSRFVADSTDYHEDLFRKRGIFGGTELGQKGTHKLMIVHNSADEASKGVLVSNKKHKDFDTKKIYDIPEEEWIIKEGAVPAIVSAEIWDKANEVLAGKRKTYNIEEKNKVAGYFQGSYVYSGKIKCSSCKETYWHQIYKYNTKNGMVEKDMWQCGTYRSFGKNTEHGCKNPHIITEDLDKMVKKVIFDFWNNKDKAIENIIKVLGESLEDGNDGQSFKKIEAEISKQQKRKENLINMRMNQEISKEEFAKQRDKIEEIIVNLNIQIKESEEKNKEKIDKMERLIHIKDYLGDKLKSPDGIDDEIIKQFLKQVTIEGDGNVTIILDGDFSFSFTKEGKEYIL